MSTILPIDEELGLKTLLVLALTTSVCVISFQYIMSCIRKRERASSSLKQPIFALTELISQLNTTITRETKLSLSTQEYIERLNNLCLATSVSIDRIASLFEYLTLSITKLIDDHPLLVLDVPQAEPLEESEIYRHAPSANMSDFEHNEPTYGPNSSSRPENHMNGQFLHHAEYTNMSKLKRFAPNAENASSAFASTKPGDAYKGETSFSMKQHENPLAPGFSSHSQTDVVDEASKATLRVDKQRSYQEQKLDSNRRLPKPSGTTEPNSSLSARHTMYASSANVCPKQIMYKEPSHSGLSSSSRLIKKPSVESQYEHKEPNNNLIASNSLAEPCLDFLAPLVSAISPPETPPNKVDAVNYPQDPLNKSNPPSSEKLLRGKSIVTLSSARASATITDMPRQKTEEVVNFGEVKQRARQQQPMTRRPAPPPLQGISDRWV